MLPITRSFRDSLYGTVRLNALEVALVDLPVFQRLREIKQLNLAYVAYDGATHTRFEHVIGVNHNAKSAIERLAARDRRFHEMVAPRDCLIFTTAALLHDLSHSGIGSHLVEELELEHGDHERAAGGLILGGPVAEVLEAYGLDEAARRRIVGLICGEQWDHPLQPLLSSSFDLDKLDYMPRDAIRCGVPYGQVDRDRLLDALVLVTHPETGAPTVALDESGLLALEHLWHGRRLMYESVYYHRAVRSASAMRQRLLVEAIKAAVLTVDECHVWTDADVRIQLTERLEARGTPMMLALHRALMERSLYKEVWTDRGPWLRQLKPAALWAVAERICEQLAVEPGAVLVDLPYKPGLMRTSGLCRLREAPHGDRILPLGDLGARFPMGQISETLETSILSLRVFAHPHLPWTAVRAVAQAAIEELLVSES